MRPGHGLSGGHHRRAGAAGLCLPPSPMRRPASCSSPRPRRAARNLGLADLPNGDGGRGHLRDRAEPVFSRSQPTCFLTCIMSEAETMKAVATGTVKGGHDVAADGRRSYQSGTALVPPSLAVHPLDRAACALQRRRALSAPKGAAGSPNSSDGLTALSSRATKISGCHGRSPSGRRHRPPHRRVSGARALYRQRRPRSATPNSSATAPSAMARIWKAGPGRSPPEGSELGERFKADYTVGDPRVHRHVSQQMPATSPGSLDGMKEVC